MTRSRGLRSFAKRITVGAAFIVVAGAPVEGAWAGADGALSGTYEGKATCSGLFQGAPNKQTHEIIGDDAARVSHRAPTRCSKVRTSAATACFEEHGRLLAAGAEVQRGAVAALPRS